MMTESEAVKTLAVVAGSRIFPKFRELLEGEIRKNTVMVYNAPDERSANRLIGVSYALRHLIDSCESALAREATEANGMPAPDPDTT